MLSSKPTQNSDICESKRCLGCNTPHCQNACPIGNDIPAFLRCVSNGEYDKAVELIGHPFGEICGYVCPHDLTCSGGCILGKRGQAVQMGTVEKAVFAKCTYKVERKGAKLNNIHVAVIGGGVAGITFAVKMYEQGASVTVYERDELLSTLKLIPDFRLPRQAIQRIEQAIDGKFEIVKQEVTSQKLAQLQQSFDIVYLSTGASALYGLGISGEDLATPYDEFLKGNNHSGDVVVIGGGNTAMDCARLAKRNGCNVTVAYRRQRLDMPAFAKEIEDACVEGVEFVYNVAPVQLVRKDGKLLLTLAKTVNEGRGKLTVTDDTVVVECDTVVSALGSKFNASIYGAVEVGEEEKHPLPNVYVGGDALGGKIVARAVADALQTAKNILAKQRK